MQVHYTSTDTDERGTAIAIVVKLMAAPSHDVTFPVYSTNTAEGTTSVTSLTFTANGWVTTGNWGNPQSIIVTGVDDPAPGVDDGHITYSVAFGRMVSDDAAYDGLSPGAAVILDNLDDDVQANGCVITHLGRQRIPDGERMRQ